MLLKLFTQKIMAGESLTQTEGHAATKALLSARTSDQIITYLSALHQKGETPAEILGTMAALREESIPLMTPYSTLDIVGTGGDGANTVNISTAAAILTASCGVRVAKHGGRAATSQAGSADVLEALGVDIEMPMEKIQKSLATLNIGFCFAPQFHPVLSSLRSIRRQINTPTIFNIALPLLNPSRPQHYLIGVRSPELLQIFADIILALNIKKTVVVHSDGIDELTCSNTAQIIEIENGKQKNYILDPLEFGFERCDKDALRGGSALHNAQLIRMAFQGEKSPITDTIILNAAMAIYIYGIANDFKDAVVIAQENLYAGKANELLNNWIMFSNNKK